MIRITATIMLVLVISISFLVPKAPAQSDKYSKMVAKPASLLLTSAPAVSKTSVAQATRTVKR